MHTSNGIYNIKYGLTRQIELFQLKWLGNKISIMYKLFSNIYYHWPPPWLRGKEFTSNEGDTGDLGSITGLGRSLGEGNGTQLQYSCLENSMSKGARWATVHRVAKSRTRLKWLSSNTIKLSKHKPFVSLCFFQISLLYWLL